MVAYVGSLFGDSLTRRSVFTGLDSPTSCLILRARSYSSTPLSSTSSFLFTLGFSSFFGSLFVPVFLTLASTFMFFASAATFFLGDSFDFIAGLRLGLAGSFLGLSLDSTISFFSSFSSAAASAFTSLTLSFLPFTAVSSTSMLLPVSSFSFSNSFAFSNSFSFSSSFSFFNISTLFLLCSRLLSELSTFSGLNVFASASATLSLFSLFSPILFTLSFDFLFTSFVTLTSFLVLSSLSGLGLLLLSDVGSIVFTSSSSNLLISEFVRELLLSFETSGIVPPFTELLVSLVSKGWETFLLLGSCLATFFATVTASVVSDFLFLADLFSSRLFRFCSTFLFGEDPFFLFVKSISEMLLLGASTNITSGLGDRILGFGDEEGECSKKARMSFCFFSFGSAEAFTPGTISSAKSSTCLVPSSPYEPASTSKSGTRSGNTLLCPFVLFAIAPGGFTTIGGLSGISTISAESSEDFFSGVLSGVLA